MKRMKKIVSLLMAVVLIAAVFTACGNPPAKDAQSPSVQTSQSAQASQPAASAQPSDTQAAGSVTDMLGKTVTLEGTPKTVISLAPSITEVLFALGEGAKVIGVDVNSDYPKETSTIEKVGDFNGPDIEKITALKPDIVFAGNTLQKDAITALEKLGFTVVAAEATDYEGIYKSIELIANVMDKQDKGNEINASLQADVEETAKKAAALTKHPSIYYAISFGQMGNWTSGPGSFVNTIMEKAGFTCVTADGGDEWMEYPLEQLVSKNPDILLLSSDVGKVEDIKKENGYKDLNAVKNDKVYLADADILSRPGVRVNEAMQFLYDILQKNQ